MKLKTSDLLFGTLVFDVEIKTSLVALKVGNSDRELIDKVGITVPLIRDGILQVRLGVLGSREL